MAIINEAYGSTIVPNVPHETFWTLKIYRASIANMIASVEELNTQALPDKSHQVCIENTKQTHYLYTHGNEITIKDCKKLKFYL